LDFGFLAIKNWSLKEFMMAGKPKPMSQIKQLLQLHQQGKSKKEIARILSISRNTVKSYLRKIEESKLHIKELLSACKNS
jgi:DNA-binding NarL/FixJ family response regulator